MLSSKLYGNFEEVVHSKGFDTFARSIVKSFKSDEDFAYWVYSGGANLFSYINALNSKEAMEELSTMIVEMFRDNVEKKDLEAIKKDKTAFKFVIKWLNELGQDAEETSRIKQLSSSKRNLYCTFLCVLLNFSSIDDNAISPEPIIEEAKEDELTDEEIEAQEFSMVSAEDLPEEIITDESNPTTDKSEIIEA